MTDYQLYCIVILGLILLGTFGFIYLLLRLEEIKRNRADQQQREPESRYINIVFSDGMSEEDVYALREQIDLAMQDPHYIIVANYHIDSVQIPIEGQTIVTGGGNPVDSGALENMLRAVRIQNGEDLPGEEAAHEDRMGALQTIQNATRASTLLEEGRRMREASAECDREIQKLKKVLDNRDPDDDSPKSNRYTMLRDKEE